MQGPFTPKHIASGDANSTVIVSTLPNATLASITINTTSAHALTVYDAAVAGDIVAGNIIAVIKASIVEQTLTYNLAVKKGISITVPASYAGSATVSFV